VPDSIDLSSVMDPYAFISRSGNENLDRMRSKAAYGTNKFEGSYIRLTCRAAEKQASLYVVNGEQSDTAIDFFPNTFVFLSTYLWLYSPCGPLAAFSIS
jgi:hypothetical protein